MSEPHPTEVHVKASIGQLRMFTQHNFLFAMSISPIAAVVVGLIAWSQGKIGLADVEDLVGTILLAVIAAIGPLMGLYFLVKQGPLLIDPEAETLTYRRHVFPFEKLGLVRVGTASTLIPSIASVESGVPGEAGKVKVAVVASGDFMLSPDDQLPRRRAEKLADHLNAVLADYYRRKGESLGPREEMRR